MKTMARGWRAFGLGLALFGGPVFGGTAAHAQYVVYDPWSVDQMIQQVTQSAQQIQQLQAQLDQLSQLTGGLNKLTNMGDIASLLKNPAIQQALPSDFNSVQAALSGNGTGSVGSQAQSLLSSNKVYTAPGNDFYANLLKSGAQANAGSESLAEQMYNAASQRIGGLQQLQAQISVSPDPKTTLDLQARIQSEMSFLQTDQLRMSALRMMQQAQLDVTKQQESENWRQRLDALTNTPANN